MRQSRLGFSKATHTGQCFCAVWQEPTLISTHPGSNLRKSLSLWGSYHQWQKLTLDDCSRKRTGSTLNSFQNWPARQGNKDQRYGWVPLLPLPSIPRSGHWLFCPWELELSSFHVTSSSFKVSMRACDWLSWGLFSHFAGEVGWGQISSVQFNHSVMSDSLRPHGLLHARLPCPSPTLGACSNSCPLSRWCYPIISSPVVPFSFCLWSFPAWGSFLMS